MIDDQRFKVNVIAATPIPQTTVYLAAHNDYYEGYVWDQLMAGEIPSEERCGELLPKMILNKGHYGCLEHPAITFSCSGFPVSMWNQLRTHRVGMSFDYQSGRYVGKRFLKVADGETTVDDVFYFRPVGQYTDRQGKRYSYTQPQREEDLDLALLTSVRYADRFRQGFSEEHCRGMVCHDYRQNAVVTMNLRSAMHVMALRMPHDAQLEIQTFCHMIYPHLEEWCPEIMGWHTRKLKGKSKLAP